MALLGPRMHGSSFKIIENTKFSITTSLGHTSILKDGTEIILVDKIKTKLEISLAKMVINAKATKMVSTTRNN